MSTVVKRTPMPLRDVLYEFAIAKETPDPELLDEFARRYPEFACEITDFAIEILCESLEDEEEVCATSSATVSPAVSRAMSKYQNALYARNARAHKHNAVESVRDATVENPFATLDRNAFRSLAHSLNVNLVFLCKLRDRQIVPGTVRAGFLRLISDTLKVPCDTILSYLSAKPLSFGVQYYKSEEKPSISEQQSFDEAVRSSDLTEEQQAFLLSL